MNKTLTQEELRILQELEQGKKSREIADLLDIPISFVKTVLLYLYKKLHVNNKKDAVNKFKGGYVHV
jgi:NarL family two-component system response regulator LiaR